MDIIKRIIELRGSDITDQISSVIKKSNETRKKVIDTPDVTVCVKLLMNDTFTYNTITSSLCLMMHTTNSFDLKYWNIADDMMLKYNIEFNTDSHLFKKLLHIAEKTTDSQYKIFCIKMLKSMEKFGVSGDNKSKVVTLIENIDKTEKMISEYMVKPTRIKFDKTSIEHQSESLLSSVNPDGETIVINKSTFYYLIKRVSDCKLRSEIENAYMLRTNNILPYLSKMLILRDIYAKTLNRANYSQLINSKNTTESENIKLLITDLNIKLDNEVKKNLEFVKRESDRKSTEKIDLHDIVYVCNRLMPNKKFTPAKVVHVVTLIIKKYFGIDMNLQKDSSLPTFMEFRLKNERGYIGTLYVDLVKQDNKNVKQPTFIRLNNYYVNPETKKIIYPNVCIMASYQDMTSPCMTYNDIVLVFREFGNMLYNITAVTPNGVLDDDIELYSFTSHIMEFFADDDEIIDMFADEMSKTNIDRLKLSRRIETIINMKLKCFYALFDNILHGSDDVIRILKDAKDNMVAKNILLELYRKAYVEVFNNVKDVMNIDILSVNPIIVQNCVNGNQGIIYGSIMSLILAYNTYILIKNGMGIKFVKDVLSNSNYCYKKSIKMFVDNVNDNYYNNFVKNYLGINTPIEDSDQESDNYYDDKESEVDIASIKSYKIKQTK
jgi:Zn-dependent oligopeptidase